MSDHILILNAPAENALAYLTRLVCELRDSRRFRERVVQIVTPCFGAGLPEPIHRLGVIHYAGDPWGAEALAASNAAANASETSGSAPGNRCERATSVTFTPMRLIIWASSAPM